MTTCLDVQPRLSEFVDGELDASERPAIAAHVAGCASCAGMVRDFEALRRAAGSLGAIEPPARVFATLAGRVSDRPDKYQWLRLAAAVAVVAAGTYGVVRFDRFDRNAATLTPPGGNAVASVSVEASGEGWRTAVTHYERAIAELEGVTKREARQMDPAIAAALRTNLQQVDDAIEQSRAALVTDPDSEPARDSLSDSLRRKVTVLEATATVIAETKGDH
jgi:anti-sigma factor RsiW